MHIHVLLLQCKDKEQAVTTLGYNILTFSTGFFNYLPKAPSKREKLFQKRAIVPYRAAGGFEYIRHLM